MRPNGVPPATDISGAADFRLFRHKFRALWRFYRLVGCLLVHTQTALIFAEALLYLVGCTPLHIVGDMGVNVECRFRGNVTYDRRQRFYIHTVGKSGCSEGVPEIVEADVLTFCSFQGSVKHFPYRRRMIRRILFYGRWEHPP